MDGQQSSILTCEPSFSDLAFEELRKVAGGVRSHRELAPGVLLVVSDRSFQELADTWRTTQPVFVRHICPVDTSILLQGEDSDVATIEGAAIEVLAGRLDPTQEFSVQCRLFSEVAYKPFDVNSRLAAALAEASGATVNVRQPQQIVSVVVADEPDTAHSVAYLGLSLAADNLSDWAGGMRRFARETGQVSRSEFKLLEAIEAFGVELQPHGVALDLGAAPGGWTRVLRQHGLYVSAVDPGALHASLSADSGVRHIKTTAEEYLLRGPDQYDIIVNDMRMDGRDSARLMAQYADYVYADGQVIMTLKLPERNRRSVIDHSKKILSRAYVVLRVKQLFHNRSEVTLHLRPKPRSHGDSD